jgi:hypothetical protein
VVGKIFTPQPREIAAEEAVGELLAQALPGVTAQVEASHTERDPVLRAKVRARAAEAAWVEIDKLPIGVKIASD